MSRLYGWGASIVIIGALFKIQHYPYAGLLLVVGMVVEAVVFFFSAFEPLHEEPDWSLVYPELAGIESDVAGTASRHITSGAHGITLAPNLDHMLEEANIGQEMINQLGRGLKNLSDNAAKLADITNAAVATNHYVQNLENASRSVSELGQTYRTASEHLKHDLSLSREYGDSLKNAVVSMGQVSEAYEETAKTARETLQASTDFGNSLRNVTGFTNQLGESYSRNAELLTKAVDALEGTTAGGQAYSEQLQKTAQNLSALNAAYELQLQAAGSQTLNAEKLKLSVNQLVENLDDSVASTEKYKQEINKLTSNIQTLNNVYGNMLSAMNVNVNRQ